MGLLLNITLWHWNSFTYGSYVALEQLEFLQAWKAGINKTETIPVGKIDFYQHYMRVLVSSILLLGEGWDHKFSVKKLHLKTYLFLYGKFLMKNY